MINRKIQYKHIYLTHIIQGKLFLSGFYIHQSGSSSITATKKKKKTSLDIFIFLLFSYSIFGFENVKATMLTPSNAFYYFFSMNGVVRIRIKGRKEAERKKVKQRRVSLSIFPVSLCLSRPLVPQLTHTHFLILLSRICILPLVALL